MTENGTRYWVNQTTRCAVCCVSEPTYNYGTRHDFCFRVATIVPELHWSGGRQSEDGSYDWPNPFRDIVMYDNSKPGYPWRHVFEDALREQNVS